MQVASVPEEEFEEGRINARGVRDFFGSATGQNVLTLDM
jgi:hypothetical protein